MHRILKSSRAAIETCGVLTICSVLDHLEIKSQDHLDRIGKKLDALDEQRNNMNVEYARLLWEIERAAERHLDSTIGNAAERARRFGGIFSARDDKRAKPREWTEFVDALFIENDDEWAVRDALMSDSKSLRSQSFKMSLRTFSVKELQELLNFTSTDGPLTMLPTLNNLKLNQVDLSQSESNSQQGKKKPALKINTISSTPLTGEQELLRVLDTLALRLAKSVAFQATCDKNFDLLEKEYDKCAEECTPLEAVQEQLGLMTMKLIASISLMMLTRRFIPVSRAVPAQVVGLAETAAAAAPAKRALWQSVLLLMAGLFTVPSSVKECINVGDFFTRQPITPILLDYLAEGEDEREEERATLLAMSKGDAEMQRAVEEDWLDEQRIVDMLRAPAPHRQVWPGSTELDPFRFEKLLIYNVLSPVFEVALFYKMLLPSLLGFLSPVAAHLLTMGTFAFYRDHSENPTQAFMKLPSLESFAHSLFTSAFSQMQMSVFHSAIVPTLTKMIESLYFSVSEMSSPAFCVAKNHLNFFEQSRASTVNNNVKRYQRFVQQVFPGSSGVESGAKATTMVSSQNIMTAAISTIFQRSKPDLEASPAKFVAPRAAGDEDVRLNAEWRACMDQIIDTYSSDHFSDRGARRMTADDAADVLIALTSLYGKGREHGDFNPIFGVKRSFLKELFCDTTASGFLATQASKNALEELKREVNDAAHRRQDKTHTERKKVSQDVLAASEDVLDWFNSTVIISTLHRLFPKGLSRSDFERLFLFALTDIDLEMREEDARILREQGSGSGNKTRLTTLSASALASQLTSWDDASLERVLDTTQAMMERILKTEVSTVPLVEPLLYKPFAQRLAGRLPTQQELQKYFDTFGDSLQRHYQFALFSFLYQNGLSVHRWKIIQEKHVAREQAAQHGKSELKELQKEWVNFFDSPLMTRKIYDAIDRPEEKRGIYDVMLHTKIGGSTANQASNNK